MKRLVYCNCCHKIIDPAIHDNKKHKKFMMNIEDYKIFKYSSYYSDRSFCLDLSTADTSIALNFDWDRLRKFNTKETIINNTIEFCKIHYHDISEIRIHFFFLYIILNNDNVIAFNSCPPELLNAIFKECHSKLNLNFCDVNLFIKAFDDFNKLSDELKLYLRIIN